MGTLKLVNEREITIEEGWGVDVFPIYEIDERAEFDSRIVEIDVQVVEITRSNMHTVGGVWCVRVGDNAWIPVENFKHVDNLTSDDTHDFRTRWFATEIEAREHVKYTENRWHHPQPWESFVCLM